ncbi:MAG: hypothetical protein QF911_05725 [Candidatus Thalassarchaeaceae archaeon]|jgi:hypothetical protein|nr:hypothetical protein [Candidatus Thalassarchaeaceae archaeon]|tara:strand:+ start:1812 stop:2090 length:279 start_codon:yes stop_codon:yes gene_type:complete
MRFAVMTIWKHPEKHDWGEAQEELDMADGIEGSTVTWFEIDEFTQGSLFVLPNREAYETVLGDLQAMRKEAVDEGSTMEVEAIGPVMAYREF